MTQTEIFNELLKECAEAGSNLSEVCRDAGVTRMTVEAWKYKEPKTLQILRKLREEIAKKKKAKLEQVA